MQLITRSGEQVSWTRRAERVSMCWLCKAWTREQRWHVDRRSSGASSVRLVCRPCFVRLGIRPAAAGQETGRSLYRALRLLGAGSYHAADSGAEDDLDAVAALAEEFLRRYWDLKARL